jgi:hypothetical protein
MWSSTYDCQDIAGKESDETRYVWNVKGEFILICPCISIAAHSRLRQLSFCETAAQRPRCDLHATSTKRSLKPQSSFRGSHRIGTELVFQKVDRFFCLAAHDTKNVTSTQRCVCGVGVWVCWCVGAVPSCQGTSHRTFLKEANRRA